MKKGTVAIHDHSIGFSDYKDHNNNHLNFLPLYGLVNRYLSNNYAVLYAAEPIPDESFKQQVIEQVTDIKESSKVKDNIKKEGMLKIINVDSFYRDKIDAQGVVNSWFSIISKAEKQLQQHHHEVNGILAINAPDPFFKHGLHDIFMSFEHKMGKTFTNNNNLTFLCWYKQKWLIDFSLASIINVLSLHANTVYNGWKYQKWNSDRITKLIGKAIDKNLGEGSSALLFRTMKAAFKFDQNMIISKPRLFEDILKKMLSSNGSEDTFNYVLDEVRKELLFSRESIRNSNRIKNIESNV